MDKRIRGVQLFLLAGLLGFNTGVSGQDISQFPDASVTTGLDQDIFSSSYLPAFQYQFKSMFALPLKGNLSLSRQDSLKTEGMNNVFKLQVDFREMNSSASGSLGVSGNIQEGTDQDNLNPGISGELGNHAYLPGKRTSPGIYGNQDNAGNHIDALLFPTSMLYQQAPRNTLLFGNTFLSGVKSSARTIQDMYDDSSFTEQQNPYPVLNNDITVDSTWAP